MKKRRLFFKKMALLTLSFSLCLSMLGNIPAYAAKSTEISLEDLKKTAGQKIQKKIDILLTKDNNQMLNASEKFAPDSEERLIAEFRERLASKGETYNASKTNYNIKKQYVDENNLLHVIADEITYLTISANNVETGYAAEHEFLFKNESGKWILLEDRQIEPTGLLPLHQAYKFVYNSSDKKNLFDKNEDISNVIYDNKVINPTEKQNESVSASRAMALSSYNYTAMANYLEMYWYDYNPTYRSFSSDCTNFASQALRHGGWEYVNGNYRDSNYWWYGAINQSWSWTGVEYLGNFALSSGRCYMLNSVWNLGVGDILQVKSAGSSERNHTMMVSYRSDGVPYFTYHSNSRYRRSLYQVLEDWGPSATYYPYRT